MTVNDSQAWQPFSSRNAGQPADLSWHEGVPEWLEYPLREWLASQLIDDGTRRQIAARLRYMPSEQFWYLQARGVPSAALLDWIDAALHVMTNDRSSLYRDLVPDEIQQIDAVLRDGRSVWNVCKAGDSLERRHDPVVMTAMREASKNAAAADRIASSAHLQAAWDAAHKFHPDPSTAYREAILAVEAAAIPVVVPAQAGATLGHVLGQLDRQGHLYSMAIRDKSGVSIPVAAVVQMIRLLWEGHTDRHEGVTPAIPITKEAAQMAATLAVTLVQWFVSGAVKRR
ncbi:hypothetical protein [Nocardia africana]